MNPGAITRAVLGLTLAAGLAAAAAVPDLPYEAEIRAFEASDLRAPPPPDPALLVGSSTFRVWTNAAAALSGYTVLNRGFGGSHLSDVLNHYERVVLRYRPSLIVLYEGDNDLAGGKTVDRIFGEWTQFAGRVERDLPTTGVVYLSVKPSPSRLALIGLQRELNRRVALDCALRPRFRFVDIFQPLLDGAGKTRPELYQSDQLHLNASGYAVVAAALRPALEAWAVAHPERSIRTAAGAVLIDLGSPEHPTAAAPPVPTEQWNNVTANVGANVQGRLTNLVTVDGSVTAAAWTTVSRFNGANTSGATTGGPFPANATRDSLFGNTEVFGGLSNLRPAFRLTGLRTGVAHALTFYASRLGSSDNRETRYTVTGRTSATADLNAANNMAAVAAVTGIEPDAEGAIAVSLAPGPRNDNANHFTYLGVLRVAEETPGGRVFLFDLGAADLAMASAPAAANDRWNNLTPPTATDPGGRMEALLAADGTPTPIGLRLVSPFVGVGLDGVVDASVFPASATRDVLTGDPGPVGPAFQLTGLPEDRVYTVGLYASRAGSATASATRYRVRGAEEFVAALMASGNAQGVAWLTGLRAAENGALGVFLESEAGVVGESGAPCLGVLRLEWRPYGDLPRPVLTDARWESGRLRVRVHTAFGRACRVESSSDLVRWTPVRSVRPPDAGGEVEWETAADVVFVRGVDEA